MQIRAFGAEIFAKQYWSFLIIDFQCIFDISAITHLLSLWSKNEEFLLFCNWWKNAILYQKTHRNITNFRFWNALLLFSVPLFLGHPEYFVLFSMYYVFTMSSAICTMNYLLCKSSYLSCVKILGGKTNTSQLFKSFLN